MLDLLRPAHRAEGLSLAAVVTILCLAGLWAISAPAHAATGQIAAFGVQADPPATGDHDLINPGPMAFDTNDTATAADDALFAADLDVDTNFTHLWPRIRKYGKDGTLKGSVSTPVGGSPQAYVVGLAVDPHLHRVYALVDADTHGNQTAQEILVYSTDCAPAPCTLAVPTGAPASLNDGVLFDFTSDAAHGVDFASGIAVDPTSGDVVVLGVNDATAGNPTGILQYIAPDGTAGTRVSGFGAGLDPDGANVNNPAGLALGPDGKVYVSTAVYQGTFPYTCTCSSASVFSMPKKTGTSTLLLTDTSQPSMLPGAYAFDLSTRFGSGSSLALSADGSTVYLMEGDNQVSRVRGFSSTTGALKIVYGGGTTTCKITDPNQIGGLAAGAGVDVAFSVWARDAGSQEPLIYLFGDGGTGCPRAAGAFKVNGTDTGTITVTKGQNVTLDASGSDLLGGTATKVSWDYGDGTFVDAPTPALTTTHKFLTPGTVQVGVKIEVDGAPATDPVYHAIQVVAPKPVASFSVSTRSPAAGGTVSFDAGDSLDPAGPDGSPTHALKEYRWDFGDGGSQTTSGPAVSHAFANGGTAALARTVKLTVVSQDGVSSNAAQQTITVAGTGGGNPAPGPGPGPAPGPGPTPKPTVQTPPTPSLSVTGVDAKGSLTLKVTCPAGGAATAGKIDLTTRVKKKVKGKTKTTTVKVGSLTFSVAAGQSKAIKIKLSSAGFKLLKKQKRLSVSAAISVTGGGKTTKALTLKAPAKRK
jgi:PKD repeat protein